MTTRMAGEALQIPMNFAYTRQGPNGWGFYGTRPDLPTTMDAVIAGARTSTLRKGLAGQLQPGANVIFTDQQGRAQPAVVTGRRTVDPSMADELSKTELWTPDFLRWYMGNNGLENGRMQQLLYQVPDMQPAAPQKFIYAGIGSRETPEPVLDVMTRMASVMEAQGRLLRSGGAPGADVAFEAGVQDPKNRAIYLPGNWFNDRRADPSAGYYDATRLPSYRDALASVNEFHPYGAGLKPFVRDLMARNAMQVLGPDLKRPADLVVAYAPGGYENKNPPFGVREGGTGQALRIARAKGVEVRNLANPTTLARAQEWLQRMGA